MKTTAMTICAAITVLAMTCAGQAASWTVNPGESIQAAIDNANAGDTINVMAGSYLSSAPILVNKSLNIAGAGMDSVDVRVDYGIATKYQSVFDVTADNVTFQHMTIGAVNQYTLDAGVMKDAKGYLVGSGNGWTHANNLTIDHVHFDGGRSAVLAAGDNFALTNSKVTGRWMRASVRLDGENFNISHNQFEGLHYQYGPVYIPESAPVSGAISYNYMANGANPGYFKTSGNVFTIEIYNENIADGGIQVIHNTFDATKNFTSDIKPGGDALRPRAFYGELDGNPDGGSWNNDEIVLTDNIFHGFAADTANGAVPTYAVYMYAVTPNADYVNADRNLFFANDEDDELYYYDGGWLLTSDTNPVNGDPLFQATGGDLDEYYALLVGSPALSAASDGTNIGAYQGAGVPEPASLALLGLGGLVALRRRK